METQQLAVVFMTREEVRDLYKVIDRLWDEAKKNYDEHPCEGHMFESLQRLNMFLLHISAVLSPSTMDQVFADLLAQAPDAQQQ